jgi:hypothetical protein
VSKNSINNKAEIHPLGLSSTKHIRVVTASKRVIKKSAQWYANEGEKHKLKGINLEAGVRTKKKI